MSTSLSSSQNSTVLFWEAILNTELTTVSALLEKKQSYLFALRNLPFERQTEFNCRTIKHLETELSLLVGLIGAVDELKNAYVDFTASVAEQLVKISVQRDYYRRELFESMVKGGAYLP